MEFDKQ